ncbi:hypothetical protein XA68_16798 [Ophiocordyceps unilateralis]|uniref:Uncharacterized protein n=1 Tax=Ophiocordyceps unilateralis TaxID=268505 RepID=A0A2A9PL53_OPHUN|nr:hypothetical protein XA68_16798 [Ophiocordyceps unilateralis]
MSLVYSYARRRRAARRPVHDANRLLIPQLERLEPDEPERLVGDVRVALERSGNIGQRRQVATRRDAPPERHYGRHTELQQRHHGPHDAEAHARVAPHQRVAPHHAWRVTALVGREEDSNVEKLDERALQAHKIRGADVGAPTEARVHAIAHGPELEMALQHGDAPLDVGQDGAIWGKGGLGAVAADGDDVGNR